MRLPFFILTLMLSVLLTSAQSTFTGIIKGKDGKPIIATISVQSKGSRTISNFSNSNATGKYIVSYQGKADSVTLTVSSMFIAKQSQTIANKSRQVDFIVNEQTLELNEVVVKAIKIKQHKDTLNYFVNGFTDQNDRVIGDVLKKMPGMEVAEDGKISFNGQVIRKFYVEDMDLLHGKYGLATNNIPVGAVSVVQVLQNHQPIKALQDKLPSSDIAVNLKLKNSAKGTLSMTGLLGGGYQPILWNAELTAMYFSKRQQNITVYKGNNTGDNVASEFRTHYDYERVQMNSNSMLHVQMPQTPPVPRKRYIDNRSNAVTTNYLIKPREDTELTTAILYYDDCIKKEGYSILEQYLPSADKLMIEERVTSTSHIHNAELASRLNVNKKNLYLNNALNVSAGWNNDIGTSLTASSVNPTNTKISQYLNQPSFSLDNTLNFVKSIKNNIYKAYFSIGYGHKPHDLTIMPGSYVEDTRLSSLTQDLLARDLGAVLRLSYSYKLKDFNLNYDVWGRSDIYSLNTELSGKDSLNITKSFDDSYRNNLWYNTYQIGATQNYIYDKGNFKANLTLPLVYYIITDNDKIPDTNTTYNRLKFQPSLSLKYEQGFFTFLASGKIGKNFGDINTSYTGFIMQGYRTLLRNTMDKLLESHSVGTDIYMSYQDVFHTLFMNMGANYNHSSKNLLYGTKYEGILSVRTVLERPTKADSYGVNFGGSKGLNFWSGTVRLFGNYNGGKGQQLIQNEVLDSRYYNYGAGTKLNITPLDFFSIGYSFYWGESKSYITDRSSDFPKMRQTSQMASLNFFPTKSVTINMNVEHQYNSAAGQRYNTFADAGVKWKHKRIDVELAINNIFNAKQYVSASYSDVSTYFYSYNLRPVSALLKFRFKIL